MKITYKSVLTSTEFLHGHVLAVYFISKHKKVNFGFPKFKFC